MTTAERRVQSVGKGEAPKTPPPRQKRADRPDCTPVTISEACRCGASVTITAPRAASETHIAGWRASHPCTTPTQADQAGRSGAGGATLGFAPESWSRIDARKGC